jgi:hypothetical protein
MTAIYQRYLGRFTLSTSAFRFSVGGNAVELTPGRYYMSGYTSESTAQLCEHMQATIRALGGSPYPAATVTQSVTTGKITIAGLGAATAITWTDTALRDLLGWTADLSGDSSYTAPNQARYCWFPSKPLAEYPGDLTEWWTQRSTSYPYRSPGGQTYGVQGTLLNEAAVKYMHLPRADVITGDTTVWESLQKYFADVIHACEPMRVFMDRTQNTSADYKTCVWGVEAEEPLGLFADFASRHIKSYNGLWTVEFMLWEYSA